MNPTKYFIGLDLGQAADYSAMAILERQKQEKGSPYFCRDLYRWPLRTSYTAIVADTVRAVNSGELQAAPVNHSFLLGGYRQQVIARRAVLAVDCTGVGAPVIDLFKRERINAELVPILITGGDKVTRENGVTRVPKRDLVSAAKLALENDKLQIGPSLPESATLVRELQNFQSKINLETAHDSYGAWREGTHDDLVLAVAIALWVAENGEDLTMYVFRRN